MKDEEMSDSILIEAYLLNTLDPDTHLQVEHRLASDVAFRSQLEEQRWIMQGFEGMQLEQVEDALKTYEVDDVSIIQPLWGRRRLLLFVGSVAAAIALCVIALNLFKATSPAQVAETYYQAPLLLTSRSVEEPLPVDMQHAMTAMASHDWDAAIRLLQSPVSPEFEEDRRYYLAHAFYQAGRHTDAMEIFTALLSGHKYRMQSEWFSALAMLRSDRIAEAQKAFQSIADQETHFYAGKARDLLRALLR
jgi:tetratricopeptide (TPR) repeat protein